MLTLLNKHKAFILGWTAGIITVLLVVLVIWLIQSAQTASKLESYRKEAVTYFEEQHYEEALIACEKILELSPADREADELRRKCRAIIEKDKLEMKRTMAQIKRRQEAKVILDRISGGTMRPDEIIRIAQDALTIDPTYGDAYQVIGYAYKDKKDYDKAYEYFSKAIEATPTQVYSCYERALIRAYIYNKPEDAIPDFEKVLQYDPDSHIGWFARGSIEFSQGKYDEAIQDYTRAIELYPDYAEAYFNRGIIYYKKSNFDVAITNYTNAIRLNPDFANAYYNRANAYADKSKTARNSDIRHELLEQAIADWREFLRIAPPAHQNIKGLKEHIDNIEKRERTVK